MRRNYNGEMEINGGHVFRKMVLNTFDQLKKHRLVKNQYDFSSKWLKRSKGYYAYIKCSGADVNAEAVLALWAECRKQKELWRDATTQHENGLPKALFKGLAEKTEQLEQNVSEAVMERYLNT